MACHPLSYPCMPLPTTPFAVARQGAGTDKIFVCGRTIQK